MSRWFRWYEGTVEDAKFRHVARLSRVTLRDVIALWAFILEDAAHLDHRGVCERPAQFMAAALDFDDGVVELILEAMAEAGLIHEPDGPVSVCNWNKRQFESDIDKTASRRKREQRSRDADTSHKHVTRDTGGSETDTETDKKKKEAIGAKQVRTYSDDFESQFWKPYPRTPVMSKSETWRAWKKLSEEEREKAIAALPRFKSWLGSKPDHPVVHACRFLSQKRFDGFDGTAIPPEPNGVSRYLS